MREIKFRAWNKETGAMVDLEKITPLALSDSMNTQLALQGISGLFLPFNEKWPLMQFIGLHDKNCKEIYEGDIVQDESIFRAPFWQYRMAWNDSKSGWIAFPLDDANYGFGLSMEGAKTLEVIGNIYDNPELLS